MGETMIDLVEMRTAVGTCIKDPELQNLFKSAPDGAREVIKLSFYSTVFPEKMDVERFRACLQVLERDLTEADLEYLIRHEDEPWLKSRFAGLLAERRSSVRKLHVRHVEGNRVSVDLNAEAVKRNLEMNELEKREEEERAAAIRKANRKFALLKTAVFVAMGLVILAGGVFWLNKRNARLREEAAAEREANERMLAQRAAEQAQRERERVEIEERRKKECAAQKAKLAAKKAEYAAIRAKREKELVERERMDEESRQRAEESRQRRENVVELIGKIDRAFNGARPLPWEKLPKARRPGAVDAKFMCVVPSEQDDRGYYEVQSRLDGAFSVVQLVKGQEGVDVNPEEWNRRLETFGGLIHDGASAYLFLPKSTAAEIPYRGADIQPSQMRLGKLMNVIYVSGISMECFSFELSVRVSGEKNATLVDTVGFGEFLLPDKVRRTVRDVAAAKVKKPAVKQKRRTVVMYDGSVTKRQINGVTLVPMNPTRITPQYLAMRSEAQRQEQEYQEMEREVIRRYEEQVDKKTEEMLESAWISISVRFRSK